MRVASDDSELGDDDSESSETEDDDYGDKTVDEGDYKCIDCGRFVFFREFSLREHEHCSTVWDCVVCDEKGLHAVELMAHYRDKHKEVARQLDSDGESEIELSKK